MDYELFRKIKKGNPDGAAALTEQYLKKAWFLCWHDVQSSRTAAAALL
ncbi:MAG: hypothetical protein LUC50_05270 [Ruminococcus sp.]|nr:hypothetical protein [Ruminococcus sp.]